MKMNKEKIPKESWALGLTTVLRHGITHRQITIHLVMDSSVNDAFHLPDKPCTHLLPLASHCRRIISPWLSWQMVLVASRIY